MSLSGKVALITGSTSGIGLAIATTLASHGITGLILNGLGTPDQISSLITTLTTKYSSCRVIHHPADMSKPAEISSMIADVVQNFGHLDILVNNAGIQHVAPTEQFGDDAWDRVIAINLSSVFHTTKHVLPHMRREGWGRIVNVASVHGVVASPNKAAYVAAKHGVIGLTKTVALETAALGPSIEITCNAIAPGWVLTPLVEQQLQVNATRDGITLEEAKRRLVSEKQPMARFTRPEDLGQMVAFLCGEAGGTVTGSVWTMDGGWTAQ
ncbi:hypothetical protein YB2330_005834 [Saitoella coloradoensis]